MPVATAPDSRSPNSQVAVFSRYYKSREVLVRQRLRHGFSTLFSRLQFSIAPPTRPSRLLSFARWTWRIAPFFAQHLVYHGSSRVPLFICRHVRVATVSSHWRRCMRRWLWTIFYATGWTRRTNSQPSQSKREWMQLTPGRAALKVSLLLLLLSPAGGVPEHVSSARPCMLLVRASSLLTRTWATTVFRAT